MIVKGVWGDGQGLKWINGFLIFGANAVTLGKLIFAATLFFTSMYHAQSRRSRFLLFYVGFMMAGAAGIFLYMLLFASWLVVCSRGKMPLADV